MSQAAECGIGPDAFWTLTPRWLDTLVQAHDRVLQRTMRFGMSVAWYTAIWQRAKRMPELSKVLREFGLAVQRRQQTEADMIAVAEQWTAHMNALYARSGGPPPLLKTARLTSLDRWLAENPGSPLILAADT